MEKMESVVRRMRWKAIFFENEKAGASKITYGFKTNKASRQNGTPESLRK